LSYYSNITQLTAVAGNEIYISSCDASNNNFHVVIGSTLFCAEGTAPTSNVARLYIIRFDSATVAGTAQTPELINTRSPAAANQTTSLGNGVANTGPGILCATSNVLTAAWRADYRRQFTAFGTGNSSAIYGIWNRKFQCHGIVSHRGFRH
jgi:hypothetical protein